MDDLWEISQAALKKAQDKTNVSIHAFVLMQNHYHLLLTTPRANIDLFQWIFANAFTRAIQAKTQRINHIFGARYKWNLINDQRYFYQVYKYIYLNPVRAGLCKSVIEYRFSTLNSLLKFEITDPVIAQHGRARVISWIDSSFSAEQVGCLKRAFVKSKFQMTTDRRERRYITFDDP
ncbi:MAG: hypothetical protein A2X86_03220 [Bdellovibrionales bacterium GWA2_49_15]|nr:MAG: hypothetical protein A2X86_03220 [Bdellovibrionales bacterium GWA2_49_15]